MGWFTSSEVVIWPLLSRVGIDRFLRWLGWPPRQGWQVESGFGYAGIVPPGKRAKNRMLIVEQGALNFQQITPWKGQFQADAMQAQPVCLGVFAPPTVDARVAVV